MLLSVNLTLSIVIFISIAMKDFMNAFAINSTNIDARNLLTNEELLIAGSCQKLWRKDKLVGRCFGFIPYKDFHNGLVKSLDVKTSEECRALCCNLKEKCISWQFVVTSDKKKTCKLTDKIVRLGLEATGTPDWCDPYPPSKWNGKRLISRGVIDNKNVCKWETDDLRTQCFGLGNEKKLNDQKLNTLQCEQECCNTNNCKIWQEFPGRGCFSSDGDGVWCEKQPAIYIGGRKCVEGFCDGREKELLN